MGLPLSICDYPVYCDLFTCYDAGSTPTGFGECYTYLQQKGPFDFTHSINTEYAIVVSGIEIPIIKTKRNFLDHVYQKYADPDTSKMAVRLISNATYWRICGFSSNNKFLFRIKEDCEIIKSTLYFLDVTNQICLFRKNIETIKFDIATSDTNRFKHPYGTQDYGSIKIKDGSKKNYTNDCLEEWHLIKDGVDAVLETTRYAPLPEFRVYASGGSDVLFDSGYPSMADKDIALILNTQPPISEDYIPWDDELRFFGFYDYRGSIDEKVQLDGGCKDYFYPAWCRGLQEDTFWKQAADSRFNIYANINPAINNEKYIPPDIAVNPLPIGSYVKHPVVGEVYQWLISTRDDRHKIISSPDVTGLVQSSLNLEHNENQNMLIMPIGVI